jgi:hypothetical protein
MTSRAGSRPVTSCSKMSLPRPFVMIGFLVDPDPHRADPDPHGTAVAAPAALRDRYHPRSRHPRLRPHPLSQPVANQSAHPATERQRPGPADNPLPHAKFSGGRDRPRREG